MKTLTLYPIHDADERESVPLARIDRQLCGLFDTPPNDGWIECLATWVEANPHGRLEEFLITLLRSRWCEAPSMVLVIEKLIEMDLSLQP